jgi:hypothetical protein
LLSRPDHSTDPTWFVADAFRFARRLERLPDILIAARSKCRRFVLGVPTSASKPQSALASFLELGRSPRTVLTRRGTPPAFGSWCRTENHPLEFPPKLDETHDHRRIRRPASGRELERLPEACARGTAALRADNAHKDEAAVYEKQLPDLRKRK